MAERLILVGYSGRDEAAVRAHVDELARHGVPAPAEVPAVWEVAVDLLTTDDEIKVLAGATSGEAEPVLILRDGEARLAVGSDHTDRDLERTDMDAAKRACPKVVSDASWPLPASWDDIELRSEVLVDGEWRPYQQSTLAALRPIEWFVERFGNDGDAVVFCGTVPVIGDLVTSAEGFRAELRRDGGALRCEYKIRV